MIFRDNLDIKANVIIDVTDVKTGKLLKQIKKHNMFVTAGKNVLRDFMNGSIVTGLTHMAIGTDNTTVTLSDVLLGTEVYRDTFTNTTSTSAQLTLKYYLSSTEANGNTLTEAGLFGNGATVTTDSGSMFARVIYTGIVKTTSIAVTITWILSL